MASRERKTLAEVAAAQGTETVEWLKVGRDEPPAGLTVLAWVVQEGCPPEEGLAFFAWRSAEDGSWHTAAGLGLEQGSNRVTHYAFELTGPVPLSYLDEMAEASDENLLREAEAKFLHRLYLERQP